MLPCFSSTKFHCLGKAGSNGCHEETVDGDGIIYQSGSVFIPNEVCEMMCVRQNKHRYSRLGLSVCIISLTKVNLECDKCESLCVSVCVC